MVSLKWSHDRLRVSPSQRTAVPRGAVRSSYSEYQSPPPALCRSWGLASSCMSDCQLRTRQLCCCRSKTVEQFAIVTSQSNTDTTLWQVEDTSLRFGLLTCARDCLACKSGALENILIHTGLLAISTEIFPTYADCSSIACHVTQQLSLHVALIAD